MQTHPILLAILAVGVKTSKVELNLHSIDLEEHPLAVCNDGTAQGYYISDNASGEEDEETWVMHLEGGGWCWDQASCAERQSQSYGLTTNKTWAASVEKTGIFDSNPENNPLSKFRKVFVPYCTSDGWMGNRAASPETENWSFRGQEAIKATISTLITRHNMGSPTPAKFVFSGCSAGGRGAMVNIDYIPEILSGLSSNVTLAFGILDSALYVDLQPITPGVTSLADQNKGVYTYANCSGRVEGSKCGDIYQSPSDRWKCLFGAYRMPTLVQRYVANAAQFDSYQLSVDVGSVVVRNYSEQQTDFALHSFQPATRQAVATLTSAFSAPCLHHCVTEELEFWNITTDGLVSFATAVSGMLSPRSTPSVVVGNCTENGINCGTGCNPVTQPW